MAFVSNFILVIIIILRATKVVHFLLPTKFILLKLWAVVYFSVLGSIIGFLFYAKPSFILRLSFVYPSLFLYSSYILCIGKPIKEKFSVLFMYSSNDNFEKKYAKVLQCIIYFVTLQPETLEVLPL